jgi:hypothetical protein
MSRTFSDIADQEERRRVMKDTLLSRTQADVDIEAQGRFRRHNPTTVTGAAPSYPSPPNGPWANPDPSGPEPTLGYDIDALPELGGAPVHALAETATPPREGSLEEETSGPSPLSLRRRSW